MLTLSAKESPYDVSDTLHQWDTRSDPNGNVLIRYTDDGGTSYTARSAVAAQSSQADPLRAKRSVSVVMTGFLRVGAPTV